jgi:nitronate monooxygenase
MKIGDLLFRIPIIQGGMGVEISLSGLAAAVANCGGGGTIAGAGIGSDEKDYITNFEQANTRALARHIDLAREKSSGIIGVNIMVALSNYQALMRAVIAKRVAYIISGAGIPRDMPEYLREIEGSVTKLIPIISSAKGARVICRLWLNRYNRLPDAFIVEGPLAGGHLGYTPDQINDPQYSLEVLVPQVVETVKEFENASGVKIPVIAAGGIYTGADIYKFLKLGATGVQMATRFVATHECDASIAFKRAYVDAKEEDIVIIESPVKMPGRALMNDFLRAASEGKRKPTVCPYHCIKTCDMVNSPYCIIRALINAQRGKLDRGFVFVGANAYRVDRIVTVRELIDSLEEEYDEAVLNENRK